MFSKVVALVQKMTNMRKILLRDHEQRSYKGSKYDKISLFYVFFSTVSSFLPIGKDNSWGLFLVFSTVLSINFSKEHIFQHHLQEKDNNFNRKYCYSLSTWKTSWFQIDFLLKVADCSSWTMNIYVKKIWNFNILVADFWSNLI